MNAAARAGTLALPRLNGQLEKQEVPPYLTNTVGGQQCTISYRVLYFARLPFISTVTARASGSFCGSEGTD
jgi:hypothetical protein